jgi:ADP-heptose:LPS heptosyltransferase
VAKIVWHKLLVKLTRQFIRRQMRHRPRRPLSELKVETVRRVLLINSTALGDLLFSTPAIRGLKKRFPAWELDILVQPGLTALIQNNPYLAHCWSFPGRNRQLLQLAQDLRARHYDLVIILHGNDPEVSLLAWLTGSPFVIGSDKSPLSFSYSHGVASSGPFEHAIERRLKFVKPLGVEVQNKRMEIFLAPAIKKEAADILTKHFGGPPPRLIALHPGGSEPYKHWPLDYFVTLGKFLNQTYQACFLIISNNSERILAETLADRIAAPAVVTGGRYNLLTVAALLSQSHLFVGNDSGPLHLALALQTPSIGLLGADDPHRIGPYQVDWGACLFKEEACHRNPCVTKRCLRTLCLEAIQPEEVIRLIQDWWEQKFLPTLTRGSTHGGKST